MNFFRKIFPLIFLITSLILLIYIFYKSKIYWSGTKNDHYFPYYLFSISLIFFSVVLMVVNQKIKEYLMIISISTVAFLYLFEGYLNYSQYREQNEVLKKKKLIAELYEKREKTQYDSRSRFDIYSDKKKVNNKITVTVPPNSFLSSNNFFPLSSVSNSETIFCNENGYYSIYQSDRYGFNNPDREWDSKLTEYMLVGDSFTHGACVNQPNDIASVLRTLTNKSVLNLGYAGNGPLIYYATLREYLRPGVKNVIFLFSEINDLFDLNNELKGTVLTNYLNDNSFTQNLKLRQNEINDLVNNKIKKVKQSEFKFEISKFIKIFYLRNSTFYNSGQKEININKFKLILEKTNDYIIKNNSKLYFVYLPEYNRYKSNYSNTNYNLVKEIVKDLNISFIDLHEQVFKKETNPLKLFPFELLGHYNSAGYKKIAEEIHRFIQD